MIDTPFDEIPKIHSLLHQTFASRKTFSIAWRQHQLLQVARMLQENHKAFADAIYEDLGKPAFEVYLTELNVMIDRAIISAKRVSEWAKEKNLEDHPDIPPLQKQWKPRVTPTPKGAVLVISPWNYPLILSIQGTIGAIAAGCTVCLKLSEVTSNYAGLVQRLVPKYLDQDAIRVVCGGVPEVTKVLELKWDHIFYTGNGTVARIIAAAAAKHLTPLTLELGGKSPVIVDPESCDLELAARRVLWGKISNCGQICVSPDYLLIPPSATQSFVTGLKKAYASFYPPNPDGTPSVFKSDSYGRIINLQHFNRLKSLLEKTEGKVLMGGGIDETERRIEPTVVLVKPGDVLLETETFGPILIIVEVEDMQRACEFISAGAHPLVLYVFSKSEKVQNQARKLTMSGNLIFNDTFMQLDVRVLPFGGVGESGYGRQVLENTFNCFTYERTSLDVPDEVEQKIFLRYPPYTERSFEVEITGNLSVKIPDSSMESGLLA
ncbi:Aldehyde/histidinol dehydrogenase [Rhodocollybia butyracea]|uniref:Aldehyde dehydrogenase n=1 Tax=Rhodocollybia butyracea TaxID=206335 RepID=A0A9P5PLZ3_9AGAR|nr:Aldehyde/histidinol dehydrogenase [Rhodocollybia butyracea]